MQFPSFDTRLIQQIHGETVVEREGRLEETPCVFGEFDGVKGFEGPDLVDEFPHIGVEN